MATDAVLNSVMRWQHHQTTTPFMPLAPGTLAAQAAAHPDPKQDPPFDPTGDEETEDTENNEEEEKEDGEKHK